MDEDFRTHLEHVTAARAELGDSMRALQDALALPLGLPVWGRRVRAALTELAHDLREHVALTESPGGLYADIGATAPRLRGEQAAQGLHALVVQRIEGLVQQPHRSRVRQGQP